MSCACFVLVHLDGKSVAEQLAESMKHGIRTSCKMPDMHEKEDMACKLQGARKIWVCNNKGFKAAAIC